AVNKMDLSGWQAARFAAIAADLADLGARFAFSSIAAVPVCATTGENIAAASPAAPWYTGPGVAALLAAAPEPAGNIGPHAADDAPSLQAAKFAAHIACLTD